MLLIQTATFERTKESALCRVNTILILTLWGLFNVREEPGNGAKQSPKFFAAILPP